MDWYCSHPMLFSWLMGIPQNEKLKSVPGGNACLLFHVYVSRVSLCWQGVKERQSGHLIASMPTRPDRRVGCAPPVVRALHNMRGQDSMCIVALLLAFMCFYQISGHQRSGPQRMLPPPGPTEAEQNSRMSGVQIEDRRVIWLGLASFNCGLFGISWLWIVSRRRNFQNFVIPGMWTKSFWGSM